MPYEALQTKQKFSKRRKQMKKYLALLLALCMVLSLCACGAKEEPAPAPETPPVTVPATAPTSYKDFSITQGMDAATAAAIVMWEMKKDFLCGK